MTAPFRRRGRFGRFFLFLSLFCFSMLNLVLADNLFQVFVSWELVGICSFLLIGFYYERPSACNAANKAFITNRVGDAGFIIGLLIVWTYLGTFNFEEIFASARSPETDAHGEKLANSRARSSARTGRSRSRRHAAVRDCRREFVSTGTDVLLFPLAVGRPEPLPRSRYDCTRTSIVDVPAARRLRHLRRHARTGCWSSPGSGIFLGCVGKSAQFPLHVWLPDAMEGPTPVTALIHAATMVAAGVYLVGRVLPAVHAGSAAGHRLHRRHHAVRRRDHRRRQTDIKKVLAYSTVSQLGYMMLALGVGGWVAGLFHLLTHAFFKALLFLGSGSVIYGCHHEQDMPKMGGLYRKMQITALTMLVGVLAIAGIAALQRLVQQGRDPRRRAGLRPRPPAAHPAVRPAAADRRVTTFYMFRMWFMTFTGKPRDHHVYEHAHESPWVMTVPLIILAVVQRRRRLGLAGVGRRRQLPRAACWRSREPAAVDVDFAPRAHTCARAPPARRRAGAGAGARRRRARRTGSSAARSPRPRRLRHAASPAYRFLCTSGTSTRSTTRRS